MQLLLLIGGRGRKAVAASTRFIQRARVGWDLHTFSSASEVALDYWLLFGDLSRASWVSHIVIRALYISLLRGGTTCVTAAAGSSIRNINTGSYCLEARAHLQCTLSSPTRFARIANHDSKDVVRTQHAPSLRDPLPPQHRKDESRKTFICI